MNNHTYRISEIVGSSPIPIDEATRSGPARTAIGLRHMGWFEVEGIRGRLEHRQIAHVQVRMKVGFRLEDPSGSGGE